MKNSKVLKPKNDATVNQSVSPSIKKASNKKNNCRKKPLSNAEDDQTPFELHKQFTIVIEHMKKCNDDYNEYSKIRDQLENHQGIYFQLGDKLKAARMKYCCSIRETFKSIINLYDRYASLLPTWDWTRFLKYCVFLLNEYYELEDTDKYNSLVNSIKPEIFKKIRNTDHPFYVARDDSQNDKKLNSAKDKNKNLPFSSINGNDVGLN